MSARHAFLDAARGLATVGMVWVHLAPSEGTGAVAAATRALEGRSAALFFVLAGMAWGIQAARGASGSVWRRAGALALLGWALHVRVWPTEVLVPLALCLVATRGVARGGRRALAWALAATLAATVVLAWRFGGLAASDWGDDGGHRGERVLGWATLRYVVFDGNYPLAPWLAFALAGALASVGGCPLPGGAGRWFAGGVAAAAAGALAGRLGALSPLLAVTWIPTSLPFVLSTGGTAVATVAVVSRWEGTRWAGALASLGRASLTHYVGHILLVVVPLRAWWPSEDWPWTVGAVAAAGYVALALALSGLWFRRWSRGPLEGVWAWIGG